MFSIIKEIVDFIKSIVIAIIAAFLIITFVFRAVTVDGVSMYPTLHNGDKLIVEKVTYYFRNPMPGDIVVIKYPADPTQQFIKRVIAVGGDKLSIINHKVYVNGVEKSEPYIFEPMNLSIDDTFSSGITIPKGTIFVMGDNRNESKDSRYSDVGFVNLKLVVGKEALRIFPFNNIGRVR